MRLLLLSTSPRYGPSDFDLNQQGVLRSWAKNRKPAKPFVLRTPKLLGDVLPRKLKRARQVSTVKDDQHVVDKVIRIQQHFIIRIAYAVGLLPRF
jgi:hypothetical protein